MITTVVDAKAPLSYFRYARPGEPIFSLAGSPIVPPSTFEPEAYINIPVSDGVISIRPERWMKSIAAEVPSLLIPSKRIHDLKVLQKNLGSFISAVKSFKPMQ